MQQALAELRQRDPEAFVWLKAAAQQAMAALQAADRSPDKAPTSAATTKAPALMPALDAFLSARTWLDSYRAVQSHPELLSDEALALLEQCIAAAHAANNPAPSLSSRNIRPCCAAAARFGIPRAFAEKMLPPRRWRRLRRLI